MLTKIYRLLADAELNLLFAKGKGLGAILLMVVALVFLVREPLTNSELIELVKSSRGR